MRRIYPPQRGHHNGGPECEEALEPALMQLVDRAELAGWSRAQALDAMVAIAKREADATREFRPARVA